MDIDWVGSIRLFLHVISATVWVGGQLVLAGLVPVLRAKDPTLPKAAANAFNRIAWPAYWVLVANDQGSGAGAVAYDVSICGATFTP